MTHYVHIVSNANGEFYPLVLNEKKSLDTLVNVAFNGSEHYEKKNTPRNRFMRDNSNPTIEHFEVETDFQDQNELRKFREGVVDAYLANGFVMIDQKYYDTLDAPADENFGYILKRRNVAEMVKKYGKNELVKGRKTLTVGEFLEKFN